MAIELLLREDHDCVAPQEKKNCQRHSFSALGYFLAKSFSLLTASETVA